MEAMHIDPTHNTFLPAQGASRDSGKKPGAGDVNGAEADATLRAEYASVLDQARSYQPSSAAVLEAKADLLAGRLDTPQAAQAAAENLLKFGI